METKTERHDVGIIVGRFQVPELHQGHLEVIEHVRSLHDKVIIFLGLSAATPSEQNPLDYQARKQMIEEAYPDVIVAYVEDMASDERWSRKLDKQIEHLTHAGQTAVLYGSRDSFIDHYHGKHDTHELEATNKVSGRQIRAEIGRKGTKASADWRSGAIWAAMARYDTAYTTVDLAIFNDVGDRILLGRKEDEDYWRLPGGFATPGSETFEADCRRECQEETSVSITDPIYVSSHKVDDWRYRGERDVIKTLLFKARKQFGDARAGDDLHEVRWFDFDQIDLADIAPNHQILIKSLREDRKREQDRAADFAVLEKFLKDKGADAEILAIANKLGGER